MQQITLPGTRLGVSRFIFGTAGLFNVGSEAKRANLLESAVDHGFTHFDTAPYYGFGTAERALKLLLARFPDLTVTTKVGLYSPGGECQSDWRVLLRKAGGRLIPGLSRPAVDWNLSRARRALDASLRRLGRGHIDLYALHEADIRLLDSEEWLRWLEDEVRVGRVRHFGIALDMDRLRPFLETRNPLGAIIQTSDSLEGCEADLLARYGRPLQITYGYLSDAIRRHGTTDARRVLGSALARNRYGAVIVSTSKPSRMAQYAELTGTAAK